MRLTLTWCADTRSSWLLSRRCYSGCGPARIHRTRPVRAASGARRSPQRTHRMRSRQRLGVSPGMCGSSRSGWPNCGNPASYTGSAPWPAASASTGASPPPRSASHRRGCPRSAAPSQFAIPHLALHCLEFCLAQAHAGGYRRRDPFLAQRLRARSYRADAELGSPCASAQLTAVAEPPMVQEVDKEPQILWAVGRKFVAAHNAMAHLVQHRTQVASPHREADFIAAPAGVPSPTPVNDGRRIALVVVVSPDLINDVLAVLQA